MSHYVLHLEKSQEFFAEGNYEAARAAAEHALESALPGQGAEAATMRALCLRKLEFNDEALALLADLVVSSPTPEACAEFALMRAERNQCDADCRDCAIKAIAENPDLPSAYIALFWCDASDGLYLDAVRNLKRGINRGAEFSPSRAFELIRGWCQELCQADAPRDAFAIIQEIGALFNSFDFIILHARLAEICQEPRIAVQFYKSALVWLRPGTMRNEVLETIARLAI